MDAVCALSATVVAPGWPWDADPWAGNLQDGTSEDVSGHLSEVAFGSKEVSILRATPQHFGAGTTHSASCSAGALEGSAVLNSRRRRTKRQPSAKPAARHTPAMQADTMTGILTRAARVELPEPELSALWVVSVCGAPVIAALGTVVGAATGGCVPLMDMDASGPMLADALLPGPEIETSIDPSGVCCVTVVGLGVGASGPGAGTVTGAAEVAGPVVLVLFADSCGAVMIVAFAGTWGAGMEVLFTGVCATGAGEGAGTAAASGLGAGCGMVAGTGAAGASVAGTWPVATAVAMAVADAEMVVPAGGNPAHTDDRCVPGLGVGIADPAPSVRYAALHVQ